MIKDTLTEEELEGIEENCCLTEYWCPETSLKVVEDYDCETIYIGRSWSSIGDDETGKQFKNSVKEEVEKLLGKECDCDTMDFTISC